MLLLLDRGFFSYELWRQMDSMGVKLLARVVKNLILRPICTLADGSYLAKVYKNSYDRQKDREGLLVRVIRYTLDDPQRVGHAEVHTLMTNLFDETLYPAEESIVLYHERWEHELVYDEQKTHQDPRRATKPAQLRSETPAGVIQEIYAVAGAFRDSVADVSGSRDGVSRPRSAIVHRLFPDTQVPVAGVQQFNAASL